VLCLFAAHALAACGHCLSTALFLFLNFFCGPGQDRDTQFQWAGPESDGEEGRGMRMRTEFETEKAAEWNAAGSFNHVKDHNRPKGCNYQTPTIEAS